jgi:hypothetical protein
VGDVVSHSRAQAVGFQDLSTDVEGVRDLVLRAAISAGLAGRIALHWRGSAGFWVEADRELGPLADELALALQRGVRWYRVALRGRELETSAFTCTSDGQRLPLTGVSDRSMLDEVPAEPSIVVEEALAVLLELHESTHHDDGWREELALP